MLSALLKIVVVSSCMWGAFFGALWWHHRQQELLKKDSRFVVKRVAARPVTQDRLPIAVLAELMKLDVASPASLFAIRPKEMGQRLLHCPAVARAKVWRLLPGTIGVEYALRTPVATIAGVKNVGVDERATAFFLFPFYVPKKLPSIVLPLGEVSTFNDVQRKLWGMKETAIAIKLLERVSEMAREHHMAVDVVDVSRLRQRSVFRREVVLVFSSLSSNEGRLYVRIESKNILSMLELLPQLFDRLLSGAFRGGTIDLRFNQMAILSGEVAQSSKS